LKKSITIAVENSKCKEREVPGEKRRPVEMNKREEGGGRVEVGIGTCYVKGTMREGKTSLHSFHSRRSGGGG